MESTKKILRSLLTANPVAMTAQQLNKDYKNTVGQPIPYQKYGYNSLEHFFRSIPDTLLLEGSGPCALVNPVVSEKSSHVMELVSRQKVERKKGGSNLKRLVITPPQEVKQYTPPTSRSNSQKIVYPNSKSHSSAISSASNSSTNHTDFQMFINSFKPSEKSVETKVSELKPIVIPMKSQAQVSYKNNNNDNQYITNNTNTRENGNLSNATLAPNIQKLIRSHMPRDYKNANEQNEENYLSGKTNKLNIPRLIKDVTPQPIDSEDYVPVAVKNNLKILIGKYPDGIWCAELPGVYRKMFKRELKYQDLGYRNLIDLCTCLKSIFHFVRPSTEDFKLYDRSKPLPANIEKNFTAASFSTNKSPSLGKDGISALPSIDWSDILAFLPQDIFKPGREIPRTFVPETTKTNDTIDIKIGEVFDVSKFWVYKDDGLLDKLMDDMQVFYDKHAEKYRVPRELIREGLYCVCIIYGEYHRALVVNTSLLDNEEIMLFYIDYGTIKNAKVELYFLHENFAKLPAQTIRCRLAGIWPPEKGAPWTFECTKEFKELIKRRDVTAKINGINWKDQYLEIFLADVTDSENVFYINNVLVERGHAKFLDEEQKNSIVDSISTPIVNLIHLFPTFLELEHGLAPSTYEMETYYGYNIPIHFCYPQYFYTDYTEEENIIEQVTNFFESHVIRSLRTDIHHNSCVDIQKIKDKKINLSYFKDFEGRITEYMLEHETIEEDACGNNSAVVTKNDDDIETISQRIEQWRANTVKELNRDDYLSDDILNLCKFNTELDPDMDYLVRDFESASGPIDDSPILKHERLESETSDSQFPEGSVLSFGDHPFNELSLSGSISLDSGEYPQIAIGSNASHKTTDYVNAFGFCSRSDQMSNEHLLTASNSESDCYEENHLQGKVEELVNISDLGEKTVFHPTNPFLSEFLQQDKSSVETDIVTNNGRIHSTNPFLSCLPALKDEHSDDTSDSTSYGTCVEEIKIQRTWSTVDMNLPQYSITEDPATSVAQPESGMSRPSYAEVQEYAQATTATYPTMATQLTSNVQKSVAQQMDSGITKPGCDVNRPEFYPQNYYCPTPYFMPPLYPYPIPPQQYPPYLNNPYYSYAQRQVFMTSTFMQKSPNIPPVSNRPVAAVCPPPGFGPKSNIYSPESNGFDFYDAYNELLKHKLNG